jgi:hypothetical protein
MRYRQYGYSKMMTPEASVAIKPRMGRKKRWHDVMGAKFPAKTFERIAAMLEENEDRTDFVREAVERELKRREEARRKHKRPRQR